VGEGHPCDIGMPQSEYLIFQEDFPEHAFRDVLYQGECDDGVRSLCQELGWDTELEALIRHPDDAA